MLRKLYHDVKFRVKPVKYDLDAALEEAQVAHEAEIEHLAELDNDQVAYLANIGQVEDPETDNLECGGI